MVGMAHPMGESKRDGLRVDFDRRLKLEFHGSQITSDGGLLAYRELDDALGLTEVAGDIFQDSRTGKNGWHGMTGQFRQSVFGRLGGYEDVNDAGRLGRDPAMRWIVGGKAVERQAASTSQMGRFETELLATDANIEVLADMNGAWIDKVHDRRPPKMIVLDMDSSVSPTHGEQQGTAYNGHFGCSCYHPLFVFTRRQSGKIFRWRRCVGVRDEVQAFALGDHFGDSVGRDNQLAARGGHTATYWTATTVPAPTKSVIAELFGQQGGGSG